MEGKDFKENQDIHVVGPGKQSIDLGDATNRQDPNIYILRKKDLETTLHLVIKCLSALHLWKYVGQ